MKVVLGSMEFGRRLSEHDSKLMMDHFLTSYQEIDTAAIYSTGQSEHIIGNHFDKIASKNGKVSTKICPIDDNFVPEKFVHQFNQSLERLRAESIDILYLHWPSKSQSIEPLLETLTDLHRKGLFSKFGLSNYSAWQVAKIASICENRGYVMPTVYQGMYNCLTRNIEQELIPCIRDFGLAFYAYNLFAGGLLTGRYRYHDRENFDDQTFCRFHGVGGDWSKVYQDRFWHKGFFDSIDAIKSVLTKERTLLQVSVDWLFHHSLLSENHGDAIILGASTLDQFDMNLSAIKLSSPLHSSVGQVINNCKTLVSGCCPSYFR